MFRLTREVRFAVNAAGGAPPGPPANSYGGVPPLTGAGQYLTLQVTLAGPLDERTQYLRNIKDIDHAVRACGVPAVAATLRGGTFGGGAGVARALFTLLRDEWPGAMLDAVRLSLTPTLAYSVLATELPMVRLSQKFEFSASHRLHNPALSDEENRRAFGKCNNPLGHGHNYEVQVTLAGEPDGNGVVLAIPAFEQMVAPVIDHFDHKHLNLEVPEFRELIPSVENISMVVYRLLKPRFANTGVKLAGVTVWETPKTWCEYAE